MKKSTPSKYRFLLNANLSRKIIPPILAQTNLDLLHVSDISKEVLSDKAIVAYAKRHRRIIITHDLDYGEIYYLREHGTFGVIMLRLHDQTSANVVKKLTEFFKSQIFRQLHLLTSLIIISDESIRVFPTE